MMNTLEIKNTNKELNRLCSSVKDLVIDEQYDESKKEIINALAKFPDAPQPHNLLGIVLEMEGEHPLAMRHFRAARALDPSYKPARENLEHFGTFNSHSKLAFDFDDCPKEAENLYNVDYDEKGVGRLVRIRH